MPYGGAGGADVGGLGKWWFQDRHQRGFGKEAAEAEERFLQRTAGMTPEQRQDEAIKFEDEIGGLARKRNLQGRGLDDDEAYLKEFRDREQLRARRSVGGAMAGGDVGGGMQAYGNYQLRDGQLDTGLAARRTGEQVSNLAGATQDGQFDQAGYNQAQVKTAGRYGDEAGVNAGVQNLQKFADQIYGKAYSLLQMGAKDEEIAGMITQGSQFDSRWGSNMGVAYEPQKGYWITREGKPIGDAPITRDQLAQHLQMLISNPDGLLTAARDASVADASERRKAERDKGEYAFKAMVDVFKNPQAQNAAKSLFDAKGALKSEGWQLYNTPQQMADGSTQQMAQKGNQLYRIVQMAADADSPLAGQMLVYDGNNNQVDPRTLGGAGEAFGAYMGVASQAETLFGLDQADRIFRAESIQALLDGGPVGGGAMGRGRPTSTDEGGEAISDPEQITAILTDMAQSFGFPVSSTKRSQADNKRVGGVANSQHLSGTAGDFPTEGKTREEIDQFAAALTKAGFEVIDEGDHLHAELPPGSEGVVASYTPEEAVGGEGGSGSGPEQAMPARGGMKKADDFDLAQNASGEIRAAQAELKEVRAIYDRFIRDYPEPQRANAALDVKTGRGGFADQDTPEVAEARAEITARLRAATAKVADATRAANATTEGIKKRNVKRGGQAIAGRYTSPSGAAGSR